MAQFAIAVLQYHQKSLLSLELDRKTDMTNVTGTRAACNPEGTRSNA